MAHSTFKLPTPRNELAISVLLGVAFAMALFVLMAPIVIQAAAEMELSPRPLMVIVAVAASTAFLTPVGTSTNLLVFAPGNYRFGDYARVGLPLSLLFLAVALVIVPQVWPLNG